MRKRKRLLTVLAAGSAVLGGGVALGQASPPVSSAPRTEAAIVSSGTLGQGMQLSTLNDDANRLALQIASIRQQVARILAERSAASSASDQAGALAAGVGQRGGLGANRQIALGPGAISQAPSTHGTTGASRNSRIAGVGGAPATHGTTGASGASRVGAPGTPPATHGTTGASSAGHQGDDGGSDG